MFTFSQRLLLISFFAIGAVNIASEKDIDRSKSIGYAESIGGPKGIALGIGLGDIHLEGIFGASYYSGSSVAQATFLATGLGAHYHLLRAQSAAFSLGARFNIGSGSATESSTNAQGLQTQVRSTDIVQWGVDIPFRVYWFPTKSVSIHTEFGIAIQLGPEQGTIFANESRNGFSLQSNEVLVRVFEGENTFGNLGLTFWW